MLGFATPTWDARRSIYTISIVSSTVILSDAQYIDISGSDRVVEPPDTSSSLFQTFLKDFVTALIVKDTESKWFASRLKESSVLKRIVHQWDLSDSVSSQSEWAQAEWRPYTLEITTQEFIIRWKLIGFVKTSPKISLRFLPPLSRPESPTQIENKDVRQITIQTTTDELEQVHDIPFVELSSEQQMRDKGVVQEARLRLALAKLKSDRLTNTYYQKYGEVLTDEDSDQSEGSEAS
jgi:hypothetical protein